MLARHGPASGASLHRASAFIYIAAKFYGCVMYADDLLLLSASVSGLQSMLDICVDFSKKHSMSFDHKKSICALFGCRSMNISAMKLDDLSIELILSST